MKSIYFINFIDRLTRYDCVRVNECHTYDDSATNDEIYFSMFENTECKPNNWQNNQHVHTSSEPLRSLRFTRSGQKKPQLLHPLLSSLLHFHQFPLMFPPHNLSNHIFHLEHEVLKIQSSNSGQFLMLMERRRILQSVTAANSAVTSKCES